jgi:hypothetical protein
LTEKILLILHYTPEAVLSLSRDEQVGRPFDELLISWIPQQLSMGVIEGSQIFVFRPPANATHGAAKLQHNAHFHAMFLIASCQPKCATPQGQRCGAVPWAAIRVNIFVNAIPSEEVGRVGR